MLATTSSRFRHPGAKAQHFKPQSERAEELATAARYCEAQTIDDSRQSSKQAVEINVLRSRGLGICRSWI